MRFRVRVIKIIIHVRNCNTSLAKDAFFLGGLKQGKVHRELRAMGKTL